MPFIILTIVATALFLLLSLVVFVAEFFESLRNKVRSAEAEANKRNHTQKLNR